jgi:hypothetical protein
MRDQDVQDREVREVGKDKKTDIIGGRTTGRLGILMSRIPSLLLSIISRVVVMLAHSKDCS